MADGKITGAFLALRYKSYEFSFFVEYSPQSFICNITISSNLFLVLILENEREVIQSCPNL